MLIKPMAPQTTLASATNVSLAKAVHIVNTNGAAVVIIRSDANDVGIGSFTLPAGQTAQVDKDGTDKLSASANGGDVKVTKIAFNVS